jgi:hypothetical protein
MNRRPPPNRARALGVTNHQQDHMIAVIGNVLVAALTVGLFTATVRLSK